MAEYIEYAYNADTYCPSCICKAIGKRRLPGKTVEESLAVYARQRGIDYAALQHDSTVFPFPGATESGLHELHYGQMCGELGMDVNSSGEPWCCATCGICHARLGGSCPQMDAIAEAEKEAREYIATFPSFTQWRESNGGGNLHAYGEAAWAAYLTESERK